MTSPNPATLSEKLGWYRPNRWGIRNRVENLDTLIEEPDPSDSKMMFLKPQWCWNVWYKCYTAIILISYFFHLPKELTNFAKEREGTALSTIIQQGKELVPGWQPCIIVCSIIEIGCLKWSLQSCNLSKLLAENVEGQWQAVRQGQQRRRLK